MGDTIAVASYWWCHIGGGTLISGATWMENSGTLPSVCEEIYKCMGGWWRSCYRALALYLCGPGFDPGSSLCKGVFLVSCQSAMGFLRVLRFPPSVGDDVTHV